MSFLRELQLSGTRALTQLRQDWTLCGVRAHLFMRALTLHHVSMTAPRRKRSAVSRSTSAAVRRESSSRGDLQREGRPVERGELQREGRLVKRG